MGGEPTIRGLGIGGIAHVGGPTIGESEPMIFDVKEFQYKYKCKHCGHEWTETRLRDKVERGPEDMTPSLDD